MSEETEKPCKEEIAPSIQTDWGITVYDSPNHSGMLVIRAKGRPWIRFSRSHDAGLVLKVAGHRYKITDDGLQEITFP